MGRHVDAAASSFDLRGTVGVAGLLGGLAWVAKYFLSDPHGTVGRALLWAGALLLTVALLGLGGRLVKGDLLALRVFVAFAVPTLVWAVFGAAVGLACGAALVRRPRPHPTS
jgi:hypothetical protein